MLASAAVRKNLRDCFNSVESNLEIAKFPRQIKTRFVMFRADLLCFEFTLQEKVFLIFGACCEMQRRGSLARTELPQKRVK